MVVLQSSFFFNPHRVRPVEGKGCAKRMDGPEDYMLDEDFRVESARDFLGTLSPEEEDFLVKQSDLSPCHNCGEWVTKRNLQGGLCTLCRKSSCHANIRGKSQVAGDNYQAFEKLVERFEELR